MGDDRKTDPIYNYMYKNPADVFILLDTRTGPEDTIRLQKKLKGVSVFNSLKSNARGIAVFFKDSIAPKTFRLLMFSPGTYPM